ncbi:hypothetical protein [Variovorax ginsengisoli]|uniref:Uncharacterized protein n=1 Tax=Variovorax ginsengisoli TaxID=363844 RepID=A0ABT8SFA4_9BURK|nr:hypothetical protein [Variovorax ginsengisoli]MDN8617849.1 hypothetical protein [Variovorax ginsengisoli]MDO1537019.1 hypothetical protein [Variovorax ginsengisoli]
MTPLEIMRALRKAMQAAEPGTHEVELEGHRILFERSDIVTILACFVDGEQTFPRPEPTSIKPEELH